jgi:hypothetical protein
VFGSCGTDEHVNVVWSARQCDTDRTEPCPSRGFIQCDRRAQLDPYIEHGDKSARPCRAHGRAEEKLSDSRATPIDCSEQPCDDAEAGGLDAQTIAGECLRSRTRTGVERYVTNHRVIDCCDKGDDRRWFRQQAHEIVVGEVRRISVQAPDRRHQPCARVEVGVGPLSERDRSGVLSGSQSFTRTAQIARAGPIL